MIYGYCRISDSSQNIQSQIDELEKFGCDEVIQEIISGVTEDKELNALISRLEGSDVLVVARVDRLGRNTRQIVTLVEELEKKDANLVILDLNIDTRSPGGRMVLEIMASVASFERKLLLEKQRKGIASAKRAGKHLGRRASYSKEALAEAVQRYRNGGVTYADIERLYKIPKSSLYLALKNS